MAQAGLRQDSTRSAARTAWALVATLAMGACSDAVAPRPAGPTIRITAVADSVFEGDTLHLTAQVLDEAGAVVPGAAVTWTVGDTILAGIIGDDSLALRQPGTVRLTARSGAATATYDLVIGRLVVQRLELTPTTISMGRTDRVPITVRAVGQGDRAITGRTVTFTSDDTLVAVVPGSGSTGSTTTGVVIALGPGSTTIRASVDGVMGTAHVGVVVVDTTFALTGYNGSPAPVLVRIDTVLSNGVPQFYENYADSGTLVLSGLLQKRYELDVWYAVYRLIQTGTTVQRVFLGRIRGHFDGGLVTVAENGDLTMVSELIGPRLEHTATLRSDGYLVHYRIAGTSSYLDLEYRRVALR